MGDVSSANVPLPPSALDELLAVAVAELEPVQARLATSRGEQWTLIASPQYRDPREPPRRTSGDVELAGRPAPANDRSVWAVVSIEENVDGPGVVISATTDAWLDDQETASCWFGIGEEVTTITGAEAAIRSLVPPLVAHLEGVLARLDAGERGLVI